MRLTWILAIVVLACAFGCSGNSDTGTSTPTPSGATASVPKGQVQSGGRGLTPAGENAASHVGSSMK